MIKTGAETRDKIGIGMIVDMDFAQDDLESPTVCSMGFGKVLSQ